MTSYDFTTTIDRSGTGSAKWLAMKEANPDVPVGIVPLSVADTDLPPVPEIAAGLQRFVGAAVLGYTRPRPSYVDAVVGWMARRHDWAVDPEWIRPSPGVVPAIFAAVRAFVEPGDGVILQTPAYYPFYRAIEGNSRTVVRNPLVVDGGAYRLDLDGLEELAARPENTMLILCSPHNPTGRVWTRDELDAVARIACDHDLTVVSDEIHFDLVRPGVHHTVLATLGDDIARRTVTCTAPSKTFNLAGVGASNIIISDEALRERFVAAQEATGFFGLTALAYEACQLAYTTGEGWLGGLLQLVARNHDVVREFFAARFPGCTVFPLEGTYLQWLDLRPLGVDADELERRNTHDALVFFDEGAMFGPEGAGFERMNLAAPAGVIDGALQRLAAAYAVERARL